MTRTDHPRPWLLSRLGSEERGVAFATVAILGAILVFMSALVAMRVFRESGSVSQDRLWEQSLQTAEGGLDHALEDMWDDWDTYEAVLTQNPDGSGVLNEQKLVDRDNVVAIADLVPASAANFYELPDGDVVVIKPDDAKYVFAVGYSPSRDALNREVRVVEAALTPPAWTPTGAMLVGGDVIPHDKLDDPDYKPKPALKLESKKGDKDVDIYGSHGNVHINGTIEFKDHNKKEFNVSGCLTAADWKKDNETWANEVYSTYEFYDEDGELAYADCPDPATVEKIQPVPVIDPFKVHYTSEWDVCPDGTVRFGPANATSDVKKSVAGEPCTGAVTTTDFGDIKDIRSTDKKVEFKWEKDKAFLEGTYFLYGHSAKVKIKDDLTVNLTVITARIGNDLECSEKDIFGNKIDDDVSGFIEIEAEKGAVWKPHSDPYSAIAVGDLKIKVKGKVKKDNSKDDRGTLFGMYATHEQFKVESNDSSGVGGEEPKGGINGTLIGEHACDAKDGKVSDKSEFKKGDMRYDGEITTTDFVVQDRDDGHYAIGFSTER